LWDKFEARIIEVVTFALVLMRTSSSLPEEETELNRLLGRFIRDAQYYLRASDTGFDRAPHLDALNQPDIASEPSEREEKRPDLQWELKDPSSRNKAEYQRFYAMECKRLGASLNPTRNLMEQYVRNGIQRFVTAEHGYGSPNTNPSAAMIGYVQSMELAEIHARVDQYCRKNSLAALKLSPNGWQRDVSFLDHTVLRSDTLSTPLILNHLWSDLRDIPTRKKTVRKKTGRKKRRSKP
jgi:hypothetical protein